MIKCLRDDAAYEAKETVVMVGTVIQRVIADPRIVFDIEKQKFVFAYDLTEDVKKSYTGSAAGFTKEDPLRRPFFNYRINESSHEVTDGIRKVTIVHFNNGQPSCVPCSVTNISVEFPCRMCSAFNGKPYQILTCECLIELTSRFAGDYEYVRHRPPPNLLGALKTRRPPPATPHPPANHHLPATHHFPTTPQVPPHAPRMQGWYG